jgi:hypothetical protein
MNCLHTHIEGQVPHQICEAVSSFSISSHCPKSLEYSAENKYFYVNKDVVMISKHLA